MLNIVCFRSHLRQNAADFPAVYHHIVGPFNPCLQPAHLFNCLHDGKSHHKRQPRCLIRGKAGTEQNRKIYVLPCRRLPYTPPPSPSRFLLVSHHHRAMGCPLFPKTFGIYIGGASLLIEINFPSRPAIVDPAF